MSPTPSRVTKEDQSKELLPPSSGSPEICVEEKTADKEDAKDEKSGKISRVAISTVGAVSVNGRRVSRPNLVEPESVVGAVPAGPEGARKKGEVESTNEPVKLVGTSSNKEGSTGPELKLPKEPSALALTSENKTLEHQSSEVKNSEHKISFQKKTSSVSSSANMDGSDRMKKDPRYRGTSSTTPGVTTVYNRRGREEPGARTEMDGSFGQPKKHPRRRDRTPPRTLQIRPNDASVSRTAGENSSQSEVGGEAAVVETTVEAHLVTSTRDFGVEEGRVTLDVDAIPKAEIVAQDSASSKKKWWLGLLWLVCAVVVGVCIAFATGAFKDKDDEEDSFDGLVPNTTDPGVPVDVLGQTYYSSETTEIDLSLRELAGTLPSELGILTMLTRLWLHENQLSGTIPLELFLLTNLIDLQLNENLITGSLPSELGLLTKLTNLLLEKNEMISGTFPTEFGLLTNLEILGLEETAMNGTIPTEIGLLQELIVFNLEEGAFTGTIPTEIFLLTLLREIDVEANLLTGTIYSEFGSLTFLEKLDLEGNDFVGTIPTEFGNLLAMKDLTMGSNRLHGTIPSELGKLEDLEELGLAENFLTGSLPIEVRDLPSLEELSYENNNITNV